MTLLHVGFLLPFFSLFEILPFGGGLSLDEIVVLTFLPFSIALTPWRALSPALLLVLIITTLCILNLSVFFYTANFFLQILNFVSYFSFFLFALSRIQFSLERVVSIYFTVLAFYVGVGFFYILIYWISPQAYTLLINLLGQANTIGTGIVGVRFFSVFHEPSHFIQFAAFGYMYLFVTWLTKVHRISMFYLIILGTSLVLSRSALALVPLLAPMIVLLIRYLFTSKGLVVFAAIMSFLVLELTVGVLPQAITQRFSDLITGLYDPNALNQLNASSGSLVNAFYVAIQTLQNTYGSGIGFGSFKEAFELYSSKNTSINLYNSVSGGSLLIRVMTELGLVGLLLLLGFFIFKLRLKVSTHPELYCFSWACLAVLLTSFARLGGYTTGIFPFAFIGYFFGDYLFQKLSHKRLLKSISTQ